MTEEVRRRCTETHFSTKRDNAIYEGNSTGMGLGLSFVVVDPGAPPGAAGDRVGAAAGGDVPGRFPAGARFGGVGKRLIWAAVAPASMRGFYESLTYIELTRERVIASLPGPVPALG